MRGEFEFGEGADGAGFGAVVLAVASSPSSVSSIHEERGGSLRGQRVKAGLTVLISLPFICPEPLCLPSVSSLLPLPSACSPCVSLSLEQRHTPVPFTISSGYKRINASSPPPPHPSASSQSSCTHHSQQGHKFVFLSSSLCILVHTLTTHTLSPNTQHIHPRPFVLRRMFRVTDAPKASLLHPQANQFFGPHQRVSREKVALVVS